MAWDGMGWTKEKWGGLLEDSNRLGDLLHDVYQQIFTPFIDSTS